MVGVNAYLYLHADNCISKINQSAKYNPESVKDYITKIIKTIREWNMFDKIYFFRNYDPTFAYKCPWVEPPGKSLSVGIHLTTSFQHTESYNPINVSLNRYDFTKLKAELIIKMKNFNRNPLHVPRLAVFDLDETLIDDQYNVLPGVYQFLKFIRKNVDLMVMWTHGNYAHGSCAIKALSDNAKFDLVITSQIDARNNVKYLGKVLDELNKNFGCTSIGFSMLFDDKFDNYDFSYNIYSMVPLNPGSIKTYYHEFTRIFPILIQTPPQYKLVYKFRELNDWCDEESSSYEIDCYECERIINNYGSLSDLQSGPMY